MKFRKRKLTTPRTPPEGRRQEPSTGITPNAVEKKGSGRNGLTEDKMMQKAGLAVLSSLARNPRLGILLESHDGKVLSVNDAFLEIFKVSRDKLVGAKSGQLFREGASLFGDLKEFSARTQTITREGKVVLGEEVRLSDGRTLERDYIPLVNNGPPEQTAFGSGFAAHLWQYRDVTDRKQFEAQLQRRDILMAEAQHLVHLGSWDWDIRTNSVTWSDELYRIYGITPREVRPTFETFLEHVHPDDRLLVKTAIEKAYSDHLPFSFSHRILRPDGSVRSLHARGVVMEDESGKPVRMVWTGLDITDGLAVEEALEQAQQRYEALVDSVEGIVWESDPSLQITFVSKQAERLLGYPVELWSTEPMFWQKHMDPRDKELVAKRCHVALEKKQKEEFEYRMLAADGRTVWLRCIVRGVQEHRAGAPFFRNKSAEAKLRGIMVDITERKNVEARLKESFDQLRNLAVRLQSIREEESTRIALEIHDELGQALTGLKMDLTWLGRKLPHNQPESGGVTDKIASMLKLIDSTIQTVRRISTELRPGVLDDLGLVAALEWQSDEFQQRTGIRCSVSLPEKPVELDRERSTAVFRVFQETLTNIARHANAKTVTITMKSDNRNVRLEVRDDGIGIPMQKVNDPQSMGLIGMRERAFFLGGKLTITGQLMQGTTVTLEVPHRPPTT